MQFFVFIILTNHFPAHRAGFPRSSRRECAPVLLKTPSGNLSLKPRVKDTQKLIKYIQHHLWEIIIGKPSKLEHAETKKEQKKKQF